METLTGIHSVREALRSGQPLDRVLVARGTGGPRLQEIVELCRQQKIPIRFEPRRALDQLARAGNHQGVVALGSPQRYVGLDTLTGARMVVALDGVEDPHNLGAVIRTVNAAGADAVIIPERRAAGITETVDRAAAGALAHVPVVRAGNLPRALDQLKAAGFWIYGLDERGEHPYDTVEYTSPSVLILGGEGKGLHEHVKKRCDFLIRIPMAGSIASLNVSVAAGVALFEWRRRLSEDIQA